MDPRIEETLAALEAAGWQVERASPPRPLPEAVASRYPDVPALALEFFTGVACCVSPDEGCWLLAADDFARPDGSDEGFGWDFLEKLFAESPRNAADSAATQAYWDAHLTVLLYVAGDYEFAALDVDPASRDFGKVVHADAIDFDAATPLAADFADFLAQVRDAARGPPARSAAQDNYFVLLIHSEIVEDMPVPAGGLAARLRRWFAGG